MECSCTVGERFVPDGVVTVESDEEITIENDETFTPTNEWQEIKPGKGLSLSLSGYVSVYMCESLAPTRK